VTRKQFAANILVMPFVLIGISLLAAWWLIADIWEVL
jgi:hypothetical protein